MTGGLLERARSYRGLFDHRVWILVHGQVVSSFGKGFLMPVMAIYFYNVKGLPLTGLGAAWLLQSIVSFFAGLLSGALADRFGRKPFMLLGLFGSGAAIVAYAFVDTLGQYFLVSALFGLVANAFGVASRATVADVTPSERRVRAFGLLYMANNFGLSLGLVVGGPMLLFLPVRTAFFVEGIAHFAYLALVLVFIRETLVKEEADGAPSVRGTVGKVLTDFRVPLRDRVFLAFIAVQILAAPAWSTFYNVLNPYLLNYARVPLSLIGPIIAINTVMVVVLAVPLAHYAEKRRKSTVILQAHYLVGWSLLAFWAAARADAGLWVAVALASIACAVYTVGEILVSPVMPALVSDLAGSPRNYGKYLSFIDIVWMVGGGIGSVVGGWFFDTGRAGLLWPTFTALILLNMLGLVLIRPVMAARMRRGREPPVAPGGGGGGVIPGEPVATVGAPVE